MFNFFNTMGRSYDTYMTALGRQQARRILLNQSDHTLKDLGISRAKLEQGVKAWPWKVLEDQPIAAKAPKRTMSYAKAIRELNSYSDRELRDIGISRGSIPSAVKEGRVGIELPSTKGPMAA